MSFDALANSLGSIPTDWIILGGLALAAALSAVRSGSERICTLALALPGAVLLLSALPTAAILGPIAKQFSTPVLQAALFGVLLAVMYMLVSRIGLSYNGGSGQTIQAGIAGLAFVVILVTISLATPALGSIWTFGPQVQGVFGETYRLWWLIGGYAALAFSRRT